MKVSEGIFDCFPTVNESQYKKKIVSEILISLTELQSALQFYFPLLNIDDYEWVINPFTISKKPNLTIAEEEQLIDLRNDVFYQSIFTHMNLNEFWLKVKKSFPLISLKAVKILLPFSSSWFCETGFSALTEIKSKKRERLLRIDDEMRVCLSSLNPRWNLICSRKQAHVSH